MSITTKDENLRDQMRARDPEAIAAIYDQYGSLVYSLFLRVTRDKAVAEDLVQELFLRVWNRGHEFDPQRGSLRVWIVWVVANMGLDYIGSVQARFTQRFRPMDALNAVPERQRDPESAIDENRAVEAAFALLSERQKQVLELAYFEGFSQTEIASRLREPLGTVKSWMRSALQSLRTSLKGGA